MNAGDFKVQGGKVLFQRVGAMNAQIQKKNKRAPEGRGVWAFPWPIFDWFFVSAGCSTPTRLRPKDLESEIKLDNKIKAKIKKRIQGIKRAKEKLLAQSTGANSWLKFDVDDKEEEIKELEEALTTNVINKNRLWTSITHKRVGPVTKRTFWYSGVVYARIGVESTYDQGWYRFENAVDYITYMRKHLINYCSGDGWGVPNEVMVLHVRGIKSTKGTPNLSSDHLEVFLPNVK